VDDSSAMSVVERAASLHQVAKFVHQWQTQLPANRFLQAFSFQILHGDERSAVEFRHFVDGDNVGMLQAPGGLGFSSKTIQKIGIVRDSGGDSFHRDEALDERISRLENYTHGSPAEFLQNLVSADLLRRGSPSEGHTPF
jgi:hypothetical protein